MRYAASEKYEILLTVGKSPLGVKKTCAQLGVTRSTFYNWLERYEQGGIEALEDKKPTPNRVWNKIPKAQCRQFLDLALKEPELSARELSVIFTENKSYFVSESSAYRLLKKHDLLPTPAWMLIKARDKFDNPTTAINQLWQTDFTYFKVIGWGWYYLSTVIDDYSRYILSRRLCTGMGTDEVEASLEAALKVAGLNQKDRPRLLSDNGSCYVSKALKVWLKDHDIDHTRGKPYHPMTQGKIERWHRTMKDKLLLENYYSPEALEAKIAEFVDYYNTRRYHESLNNLTPQQVWLGQGQAILKRRSQIKTRTLNQRKSIHFKHLCA
jgi:putative transposase